MKHLCHFWTFLLNAVASTVCIVVLLVFCARKKPTKDKRKKGTPSTPRKTPSFSSDDSFEDHAPVKREARRADEIRKRKHVSSTREDYKTFNAENMPESDFDKSIT